MGTRVTLGLQPCPPEFSRPSAICVWNFFSAQHCNKYIKDPMFASLLKDDVTFWDKKILPSPPISHQLLHWGNSCQSHLILSWPKLKQSIQDVVPSIHRNSKSFFHARPRDKQGANPLASSLVWGHDWFWWVAWLLMLLNGGMPAWRQILALITLTFIILAANQNQRPTADTIRKSVKGGNC